MPEFPADMAVADVSMNNRRSYLDSVNAGRRRRSSTSLEQLNETLAELENRIRRPIAPSDGESLFGRSRHFDGARQHQDDTRKWDELARRAAPRSDHPMVDELRSLREEVRTQMTTGLRREFAELRQEIDQALQGSGAVADAGELKAEFERLSGMIHRLAEQSDDRQINLLRQEMEGVKSSLGKLAREETVQSFDRRWDELDRRWNDIAAKVSAPQAGPHDGAVLDALSHRLETISAAVEKLPSSVTMRSLEEKMKILASAVDQFAHQQDRVSAATLEAIEERLDEISRAVAASSAVAFSPSFDPEPFERIEARISSLARQLVSIVEENPANALAGQLADLGVRVEEIARRVDMPDDMVSRLASQIDVISRKLDETQAGPDVETLLEGMERRFVNVASMLEQRQDDAVEQGRALFRDLERRLDDVTVHLGEREPYGDALASDHILQAMDERFAELAGRLERQPIVEAGAASVDTELLRSLEAQIAGLTAQISSPDFAQIHPRLDRIEDTIEDNRRLVVEAARLAAEEAVRNITPGTADDAVIATLTDDLKTLEALARRSDERNTKTFEAIHDTLLKIVDRLSMLESAQEEQHERREKVRNTLPETPSFAPAEDALSLAPDAHEMSAAEAALEGAIETVRAADKVVDTEPKRSMLSGLAKALSGRKAKQTAESEPVAATPSMPAAEVPEFSAPLLEAETALDPQIANEPLVPGSGAPDLNAIMKRVRSAKTAAPQAGDAEIAKADFIAAARRAAQAAAAETDPSKAGENGKGEKKGTRSLFGKSRAPLLAGVAVVALTILGLQIGRTIVADDSQALQLNSGNAEEGAVALQGETGTEENLVSEQSAVLEEPARPQPDPAGDMAWLDPTISNALPEVEEPPAPVEQVALPAEPSAEEVAAIPVNAGPIALREAAASGDPKALFEIASRYAEGRGVEADMAEAAKWYEQAADQGLAPAQYRIGNLYEKGIGVERDVAKAKTWYQLAATQGNASAMHNLAVLHAMGADKVTDHDSAARWFLEAAERGVRDSQFNLGILAAKGVGMKQNLEEAYKWFDLVARAGDKDAAEKRDEVAKALSAESLQRARNAAELWEVREADPEANAVEIPDSWSEGSETTASIDMRQAVRNIQRILNAQGFDAGAEDGVMGERTREAITAFQKANGIPATGEVDEVLVRSLLDRRGA